MTLNFGNFKSLQFDIKPMENHDVVNFKFFFFRPMVQFLYFHPSHMSVILDKVSSCL